MEYTNGWDKICDNCGHSWNYDSWPLICDSDWENLDRWKFSWHINVYVGFQLRDSFSSIERFYCSGILFTEYVGKYNLLKVSIIYISKVKYYLYNERKSYVNLFETKKIVLSWEPKRNFLCNEERYIWSKCLLYFKDLLLKIKDTLLKDKEPGFLTQKRFSYLQILFSLGFQLNTNFLSLYLIFIYKYHIK